MVESPIVLIEVGHQEKEGERKTDRHDHLT